MTVQKYGPDEINGKYQNTILILKGTSSKKAATIKSDRLNKPI
jgi:hypothetical protein